MALVTTKFGKKVYVDDAHTLRMQNTINNLNNNLQNKVEIAVNRQRKRNDSIELGNSRTKPNTRYNRLAQWIGDDMNRNEDLTAKTVDDGVIYSV